jgi:hypothetical protein
MPTPNLNLDPGENGQLPARKAALAVKRAQKWNRFKSLAITLLSSLFGISTLIFAVGTWDLTLRKAQQLIISKPPDPSIELPNEILEDKRNNDPAVAASLDRELTAIDFENVKFDSPERMKVGKPEQVSVIIPTTALREVNATIKNSRDSQLRDLDLEIVGATLKGTTGFFKIDLKGQSADKYIVIGQEGVWQYDVTPETSGEAELFLTVYFVPRDAKTNAVYEFPIRRRKIIIQPSFKVWMQQFVANHWEKLLAAILVAVAGLALNKARKWWGRNDKKGPPPWEHA